jgi:hypothetical protein
MIKELPESEGSLLGFEITGKVSLEEEKEWIGKFNDLSNRTIDLSKK